jgi:alkaline phosphatase D
MLGHVEYKEARIWLQTKQESKVYIQYQNINEPKTTHRSEVLYSSKKDACALTFLLDKVQPGQAYQYDIFVDDRKVQIPYPTRFRTQEDWKFKTDPAPFTAVFGSCTYINETITDRPGTPYGGDYRIFSSILEKKPDIMLWGGDNIYLRPVDWGSRTGFLHRYTHTRSNPDMKLLLASCPQYAIWDDHDFGPNDSNGSYFLKPVAHETFRLFWANPPMVTFREGQSICTQIEYNGIDIFTLDNRSFRTEIFSDTSKRQVFGREQLEWLINNLRFSQSPFKLVMVGGQILNTATVFENFANFPEERNYLLRRIEEENIKGVIFLTGDRHHSEISRYTNVKGNTVIDITSSPLTSGVGAALNANEPNQNRVAGSLIRQRNFAALSFSGARKDRRLDITYYDSDGQKLFTYTIHEKDLYADNK